VNPFLELIDALHQAAVRFVLIGVAGANYYASDAATVFTTHDRDLLLPHDADNLLRAWRACAACGLQLRASREPLDEPRDLWLAEQVVSRRALTQATDGGELHVDLTFVMGAFEFDDIWRERRAFIDDGREIPVARLMHIVKSKAQAGRAKDRLFLATHAEALQEMLGGEIPYEDPGA